VGGLSYETLTTVQRASYYDELANPIARSDLRASVLSLDHAFQGDISRSVEAQGSSVALSRDSDVERSCMLTAIDLDGDLTELDLRNLVRVEHGLYVPDLSDWVFTKVITGRVMMPSDNGDTISLEIHGKESFGLLPGAPSRTWTQGRTVAGAIQAMFEDIGETFFRISPELLGANAPKLSGPVQTGGPDEEKAPTRVARRLGNRADLQVFWDAEGYLVVRRPPEAPLAVWTEETEPTKPSVTPLNSRIQWSRDLRDVRNVVQAKGKRALRAEVVAPATHIYAPSSPGMMRGGKPGRLVHYWEDTTISRQSELVDRANKVLTDLLNEKTSAKMDVTPVFHVGQQDLIGARRSDGKWGQWFLQDANIPLSLGESMTVGYHPSYTGRVR
jgi:hypothetical protein